MYQEKIIKLCNKKVEDFSREDIDYINNIIKDLDQGRIRVAYKKDNSWTINTWVKQAILLYFSIKNKCLIPNAPEDSCWYDKIPNKFKNWSDNDFRDINLRTVPMSYVRYGAYIAKDVIIMPSFINIGAYVDSSTMIDSWVTIGSCAQIGKRNHISADVCIGGVLEPIQNNPVIIEDDCFIGTGAKVLEGVIVKRGAIVGAGCVITATTRIIDRESGIISYGEIPEYSVVVPGSIATKNNIYLSGVVIVKTVDEKTKAKVSINELLRV